MEITLQKLSKRFNQEVIFKNIDYTFRSGEFYAITGANGSGKSTLLKTISGFSLPSKGNLTYTVDNKIVAPENVYQHITFASPYMDLIEDFTLTELIEYHSKFRNLKNGFSAIEVIEKLQLQTASKKLVKNFSSGMKQRVKLGLAFFTQSAVLLLDEPTTNLDERGVQWYLGEINKITDQMIILASNQPIEYEASDHEIKMSDYK